MKTWLICVAVTWKETAEFWSTAIFRITSLHKRFLAEAIAVCNSASKQDVTFALVQRGLLFFMRKFNNILFRDIKASNILLDKSLMPKISDFGLAKFFPDNLTHISTSVAGTTGYLVPEYAISIRFMELVY